MLRLLLASVAAAVLAFPVDAANLPLKAPLPPPTPACTTASCTGFYFGADIGNSTGTSNILTAPLTGIATNGMLFAGHAGYELYTGNFVASAEGFVSYDFNQNFGIAGIGGLQKNISYGFLAGVGVNLATTFGIGVTQPQATIPVPQSLLQSLMAPQVKFGYCNRHQQGAVCSGLQVQALIANNWTFDGKWLNLQYNNGTADATGLVAAMGVSQKTENLFLFGVSRHFAY
jgi:hypothetical protein